MIMHQKAKDDNFFKVELQLKIDTLFHGDNRTHDVYEKIRAIDANSSIEDPPAIKILNKRIKKEYDNMRKRINENAIHQYNMMVLEKIFRIEDNDYRPLRVKPDNKDGTYNKCCNFITENYLVESYDDFNPSTAFSSDNIMNKAAYLKIIGKLPKTFDELSENAPQEINNTYASLDKQEIERFININKIAHRYQPIIQKLIDKRKIKDGKVPPIQVPSITKNTGRS